MTEGFTLPVSPAVAELQRNLDAREARAEKLKQAMGTKKYIPEYCEMVVQTLATGAGMMVFAKKVGANKAAIKRWAKEHPEFAEAIDDAIAARGAYWEQEIINCSLVGKSASVAQWTLKNIDPEEYKDKTEVVATNLNHNIDREADIKDIRAKFNVVAMKPPVANSGVTDASE